MKIEIKKNLTKILNELKSNSVKLVAVSKTKPASDILEAYSAGQRIFGENRVQELTEKYPQLPKDIEWHMIGHLQTNKVKYIASFVNLIHSVDSLKLLSAINKEGIKNNRIIDCLLQIYIANEETKYGFSKEEVSHLLEAAEYKELQNVRIAGLMGMATFTNDQEQFRKEFKFLKSTFEEIKNRYFENEESFKEISMGMSGDYKVAMEEGCTLVRIGSLVFGARD